MIQSLGGDSFGTLQEREGGRAKAYAMRTKGGG